MQSSRTLVRSVRIPALDGFELGATLFEPIDRPRAIVVVNGAMAVPAGFYRRFADHLAASGLAVLTYDYRGVGASRPAELKGFRATATDWAELDARAALAFAQRSVPAAPLVLVGHSFGGQLIGLLDEAREAKGALLVAAQLGWFGHWPLPTRLRLAVIWHALLPTLTATFGYLPGHFGMGEDLPAGVAEEWASWCRHPEYLIGYQPAARARFARFDKPTLAWSFSDDDYAPEASVEALVGALSGAPLEHRRLSPAELGVGAIGHFGFFRSRFADTLWRDARWFIDDLVQERARFRTPPVRAPWAFCEEDVIADLNYGRN